MLDKERRTDLPRKGAANQLQPTNLIELNESHFLEIEKDEAVYKFKETLNSMEQFLEDIAHTS